MALSDGILLWPDTPWLDTPWLDTPWLDTVNMVSPQATYLLRQHIPSGSWECSRSFLRTKTAIKFSGVWGSCSDRLWFRAAERDSWGWGRSLDRSWTGAAEPQFLDQRNWLNKSKLVQMYLTNKTMKPINSIYLYSWEISRERDIKGI